jgi:cyclopropane fatty-acyl-phospholipid synthase-like methyltransferase
VRKDRRQVPYCDFLCDRIDQGDVELQKAFGLHVHWGYWPDVRTATGSIGDFAQAAERLSRRVCDAASVRDGMRILDVGCGLGGTLASLNSRFHDVDLVGVNIDSRQLGYARQQVNPRPGNRVAYITADACELPFASESFDAVLAVECIFHFPSRARFLKEARRLLRPGCLLALSDFVPRANTFPLLGLMFAFFRASIQRTYGNCDARCTLPKYRALAKKAGLSSLACEDITVNTLPTYKILRQLNSSTVGFSRHAKKSTRFLEWVSRAGWLRYLVLTMARENTKTTP